MGALAWGSSQELANALFRCPKPPTTIHQLVPLTPAEAGGVLLTHLEFENLLRTQLEYRLCAMNALNKTSSVASLYCLLDLFEWETSGSAELEASIVHEFVAPASPREIFLDPALRAAIVSSSGDRSAHFANLKKFILADLQFNPALGELMFVASKA